MMLLKIHCMLNNGIPWNINNCLLENGCAKFNSVAFPIFIFKASRSPAPPPPPPQTHTHKHTNMCLLHPKCSLGIQLRLQMRRGSHSSVRCFSQYFPVFLYISCFLKPARADMQLIVPLQWLIFSGQYFFYRFYMTFL